MVRIADKEYEKCVAVLKDLPWGSIQNDTYDSKSDFIYYVNSVDLVEKLSAINGCSFEYALNRFYCYITSKRVEQILWKLGAKREKNERNHDVDIYINEIPFDIKLTVLPRLFKGENLKSRETKNKLASWYMKNASNGRRHQNCNRLYIVCTGDTYEECLAMKSDFLSIEEACKEFLRYYKDRPFNMIEDNYVDVIIV